MKQHSNRLYQCVSLGDAALGIATRLRVAVWSEVVSLCENYLPERRYYLVLFSERLVDYRTFITTSGDNYSLGINNTNNSSSSIVVTIVKNTTLQYNNNGNGKKRKGK